MGYQEPLPHKWKMVVALVLALVCGAAIWNTLPTPEADPPYPTQEDLVKTLLSQMRHNTSHQRISAETPMMWVVIANREPIWNSLHQFPPQDMCATNEGDIAALVNVQQDCLLLRYATRDNLGGTTCPNGTLFFVSAGSTPCPDSY